MSTDQERIVRDRINDINILQERLASESWVWPIGACPDKLIRASILLGQARAELLDMVPALAEEHSRLGMGGRL